jgi:flagellar biosynthesis protein
MSDESSRRDASAKQRKAVAVRYESGQDRAPRVVAKGRGSIAERIIEVAQAHGVPYYEDPNLVQALEALDMDTEIPPQLYRAVAEVLAFIYRLNRRTP